MKRVISLQKSINNIGFKGPYISNYLFCARLIINVVDIDPFKGCELIESTIITPDFNEEMNVDVDQKEDNETKINAKEVERPTKKRKKNDG